MKFNKGQGALEYLLLIGGAVLIAVIVIALLVGLGGQGRKDAQGQATNLGEIQGQTPQAAMLTNVIINTDRNELTLTWAANGGVDANVVVTDIGNVVIDEFVITSNNIVPVGVLTAGQYKAYIETTSAGQRVNSNIVTFTAQ